MRYKLLFLAAILSCKLMAQITITKNDMPNAGDTLRVSYAANIIAVDPVATGANHTWDFTTLTPAFQNLEKIVATSQTPYALIMGLLGASYGQYVYTPDSMPGLGAMPQDVYNFYKESSADYRQIGMGINYAGFAIPFPFSSHDIIYKFPLNYGNTDSSNSAYSIPIPNMFYYGQAKKRVNYVDGWGLLKTPFGSFNTLRVRSVIAIKDTFNLDSLSIGTSIERPLAFEYKWLGQGSKIPLLQINANDIGGKIVVSSVIYRDSIRPVPQVGIKDNITDRQTAVLMFPNPARNMLNINYPEDWKSVPDVEVFDFFGRKISNLDKEEKSGMITIDISRLPAGTYLFKMAHEKHIVTRTIIKE